MSYGVAWAMGKALHGLSILLIAGFVTIGAVRAETVRILAFGDSLTAGYGLPADQGLVPRMQAWLDAQGADVHLVGAGVSGDTTTGGLSRLDWAMEPGLDAIMIELGANDALRGLSPEQARANLAGMIEIAQAKQLDVLLVGVRVPGNYGQDYQQAFNAVWPDLAQEYGTLYYPDFFAGIGKPPAEALEFMQDDGIHPNEKGLERIVPAIGPQIIALAERARGD
ncbi:arylesterase [Rhodalgimonas zhirmunskyi]|uniref:Arylesterase n=1 Tax=Rhodalgimonas zhirmunskyi TaxID=2964767 RepID=A0AAJ1X4U4_9RHOB|nr:arylesterase [Rhodoalgimonas zhirmunskyi]MDQ2094613.1 arylesterase [Rhodoalgimonas zhirmunskyi]